MAIVLSGVHSRVCDVTRWPKTRAGCTLRSDPNACEFPGKFIRAKLALSDFTEKGFSITSGKSLQEVSSQLAELAIEPVGQIPLARLPTYRGWSERRNIPYKIFSTKR